MIAKPATPTSITLAAVARAEGSVTLPGSKSISNRTLLLAALADGDTTLHDLLEADDTQRMLDALKQLGVALEFDRCAGKCRVHGSGSRFAVRSAKLFLGNAGTAFRPLTAALAMLGGDYRLSGVARMHERPIGDLVDALRQAGATIEYGAQDGYPPLHITGAGARAGGEIRIRGDVSSQFLSALLLALPLAEGSADAATTVRVTTPLISRPYVTITTSLMARFGVEVAIPSESTFIVPAGARYRSPGDVHVEGDASAASYFLAAGAVGGGPVRVIGVGRDSIQGDVEFAAVLAQQGADIRHGEDWIEARSGARLRGGVIDCIRIPDAAMTLAVTALFAQAPTRLLNIGSWRVKETDRIAAMVTELRKLGAGVRNGDDWMEIDPCAHPVHASIETYDDHRMAMCFSLVSLAGVAVTIIDPACVRKTFPDYFEAFARIAHAT